MKMGYLQSGWSKYFILFFSLFLISFLIVSGSTNASASSTITQWNSITEDSSDSFSVDMHIDESNEVEFTVSSDFTCAWTWSVNEEEIKESEGESTELSYVFDEYGIYNVCVVGEGETVQACWNVTVWLLIEDENDAQDIVGLEAYILRISKRPERIVSMAPSATEILFAVGAGDSVVGVTSFCDYPPEVVDKVNNGEIEVIGGYSTPSLEKIVNSEPDLIVSAYGNPDDVIYGLIEFYGYPVYAQNPKNIDEILGHINAIGAITKCVETASSVVNELRADLDEIEEETESLEEEQRPRVFYNIGDFFTAGKETFANEIIEIAGGKNIAAYKSGYYTMSTEKFIDKNPQVIICDSGHGGMSIAYDQIVNDERLKDVDAVKNDRVYKIDTNIISRPGPRVVEAVKIVHGNLSGLFNIPCKGSTKIKGAYFDVPFMNLEISTKGDKNLALRCNITKIEETEVQKKLLIGKEVDFGKNFTIKVEIEKNLEERWGIGFYNVNEESWEVYEVIEEEEDGYGDEEEGNSSSYEEEKTAIKAGEERTIELDDECLRNITIKAKEDVEFTNVSLNISKELKISQPPAMVYRYLNLSADNLTGDVEWFKLNFRVNESWIVTKGDNNTTAITLFCYDCNNDSWIELNTSKIGEGNSKAYYTATSPSFGTFAICLLKLKSVESQTPAAPEVVVTPSATPTSTPAHTSIPTSTPTPKRSPTSTPRPSGFEVVFAVAGLLVVAYLVSRNNK